MILIKDQEFGGERPLYTLHDARLENVTIHLGESSIKESGNIEAEACTFEGKYVLWECEDFRLNNCLFKETSRSSLWYSRKGRLTNCRVEAPKMFRRMRGIYLENCEFPLAQETMWDCDEVVIKRCRAEHGDYFGMHTNDVEIEDFHLDGNYSFQYSRNVVIRNSLLNSKDSFWECENVTIYDSVINGEYLGWYSKNLRLVRCHITGEQPLCYCENLVMEDCTFGDDANLAFEYCTVQATLRGKVHSIKNPTSGFITVEGEVGEIILDENCLPPANCKITII